MIHMRDLRVDYDEVCAVRDLTLDIGPGEIYGLIGPNGAGKTSTLKTLMGLIEPTYGDIVLGSVDIRENREKASRIVGFMPDFSPIYEDLTVWEFLDLFASSYLVPADQRSKKINYYLDIVDLSEKRNAMTKGLSRGMKQRLMIAKTLLPEPQILLLDEPASGMDPYGRALLKETLRKLGSEGKTVMISSHILPELSDFCTSAGIMEKGRMVISGRIEEITRKVFEHAEITVETVSGEEHFEQAVSGNPHVGTVQRNGSIFKFTFDGGAEEASNLLTALVSSGVRVSLFARKNETLEDVFLKVGAKEVS